MPSTSFSNLAILMSPYLHHLCIGSLNKFCIFNIAILITNLVNISGFDIVSSATDTTDNWVVSKIVIESTWISQADFEVDIFPCFLNDVTISTPALQIVRPAIGSTRSARLTGGRSHSALSQGLLCPPIRPQVYHPLSPSLPTHPCHLIL